MTNDDQEQRKPGRPKVVEYSLLCGFTEDQRAWLDRQRAAGNTAASVLRDLVTREMQGDQGV